MADGKVDLTQLSDEQLAERIAELMLARKLARERWEQATRAANEAKEALDALSIRLARAHRTRDRRNLESWAAQQVPE